MAGETRGAWSAWARDSVLSRVADDLSLSTAARDRLAAGPTIEATGARLACRSDWLAFELTSEAIEEPPTQLVTSAVAALLDELKECAGGKAGINCRCLPHDVTEPSADIAIGTQACGNVTGGGRAQPCARHRATTT
jgi:hypothetical protein